MEKQTEQSRAKELLATGPRRAGDLVKQGLSYTAQKRLVEHGFIEKLGRGLYGLMGAEYDENRQLLEVCHRVPKGVICLLSALQYHGLTTELPHEIWLGLEEGSWEPKLEHPPVRVSRYSAKSFNAGIEQYPVPGGEIRVFSPGKTVADCFKFRGKVGKDVAVAALKDCWNKKLATMDELTRYAKICRVYNVMRPYLETVVNG